MPEREARPPRLPRPTFFFDGSDFYNSRVKDGSDEFLPRSNSPSESESNQRLTGADAGQQRTSAEAYRNSDAYRIGDAAARSSLAAGGSNPNLAFRYSYSTRPPFPPSAFPDIGLEREFPQSSDLRSRRSIEAMESPRPFRPALADLARSSFTSFAPPPAPWMRNESDTGSYSSMTPPVLPSTPRSKKPFQSHLLKGEVPKPWLERKDPWATSSWWITFLLIILGFGASAVYCFFGYMSVPRLGAICLVLEDNFDTLDTNVWQREVQLGGFGNGQFDWTTANEANSFVEDGILYIVPTLTEEDPGLTTAQLTSNFTLLLPSCNGTASTQTIPRGMTNVAKSGTSPGCCTSSNATNCIASANAGLQKILNPIQSARLTTRLSHSITYGRVEVRAKLPKGDWIWPALWMLPVEETYGKWPLSGEIDIMEARGNAPPYPAQGRNYFTSALNWGPTLALNSFRKTLGWRFERRTSYDQGFHDYVLEWSPDFLWIYVDNRLKKSIDLRFNKESFFDRGKFPATIQNGDDVSVLKNPWLGRGNSAPFDQPFYLIMNVAVGGTNGWFQDRAGGKPWLDQSRSAMSDFYLDKASWYSTWPEDSKERGLAIDHVRMYQKC